MLLSQLQFQKSVVIYFLTVFKDDASVLTVPRGLTFFSRSEDLWHEEFQNKRPLM